MPKMTNEKRKDLTKQAKAICDLAEKPDGILLIAQIAGLTKIENKENNVKHQS